MDKIADMLITIKNAAMVGKEKVEVPHSIFKEEIAKVLVREGYLIKQEAKPARNASHNIARSSNRRKNGKILELTLGNIANVKLRSTVSRAQYAKAKENLRPKIGLGTVLLSTSKGVMTAREAKKQGVGGKILAEVSK